MTDPLASLILPRQGRTRRFSSWDRTGGNADWWSLAPGESKVIAEARGAGVVRHLWFTLNHKDPCYLRKTLIRAWWDDEPHPSIEAPLGDFFCLGHGIVRSFQNAAFNAVCHQDLEGGLGGGVALNCYFQMPYAVSMRFEIENQSSQPCDNLYFYVDYDELAGSISSRRFHAQYRQEYPAAVAGGTLISRGEHYWDHMKEPNLSGEENYVILEAHGAGHYVGCCLSVENKDPMFPMGPDGKRRPELTWWGEGDDMIFIDGDTWPPSLHGTGSEDYLTQAWGMHDKAFLYAGASIFEDDPRHEGRHALTSYRLHVADPVVFHDRIRVTIEHGHANLQQNDYSSVAYWYQAEPHRDYPGLPGPDDRIPGFAAS
jgi:hypothetical protein